MGGEGGGWLRTCWLSFAPGPENGPLTFFNTLPVYLTYYLWIGNRAEMMARGKEDTIADPPMHTNEDAQR